MHQPGPLNTVTVLCWNQSAFVADCLDSIAASDQSSGRRVVVIDNGSTDGSSNVIRQFLRGRGHNWDFLELPNNLGIPRALNLALDGSDTPFFSAIAADDFVHPERFSIQEEALLAYDFEVVMVSGAIIRTSADGVPYSQEKVPAVSPEGGRYSFREALFTPEGRQHYRGSRWACNQLWRRSAIVEAGGFDTRFLAEDVPLEIRAAVLLPSRFESQAEAVVFYRQHPSSAMRSLWATEWFTMLQTYLTELPFTEAERADVLASCRSWGARSSYEEALLALGQRNPGSRQRLMRQVMLRGLPFRSRVNATRLALSPAGPTTAAGRYRAAPKPTPVEGG